MARSWRHGKKKPKYLDDITHSVKPVKPGGAIDPLSSEKFLGLYDENLLMEKFEKAGILDILNRKGYRKLVVSITRRDEFKSSLFVDFQSDRDEPTRLIELIVREGVFRPKQVFLEGFDFNEGLSMLMIEWLALQDPKALFPPDRPRLPGQEHPGMGMLKYMQGVLFSFGRETYKDAIIDIPEFYHSAVIYSRLYSELYSRSYSFFSPVDAEQLQAMLRDFKEFPLADVSFAVALDCLRNSDNTPASWKPSEQIYPISEKLHKYFDHALYRGAAERAAGQFSFIMDWDRFRCLRKQGLTNEL